MTANTASDTSECDARPLASQTAAPPTIPPKRPIVGLTVADDGWRERFQEQRKQLATLLDQCDANLAANQAALTAWEAHNQWIVDALKPPSNPDAS